LPQKTPEFVAAVDLGSNSFHMLVCSLTDDKLQTVDRLKEMVRLASGLDKHKYLDDITQQQALQCLERFGQRIKQFPSGSVQIVGTNTLRTASNAQQFITKAEQALGHPIHVISGTEEARLIYQGVAHSLETNAKRRFVMDIGGGSTEYIIGTGKKSQRKESVPIGCVSMTHKFFKNNKVTQKSFQQAILHAEQLLEPYQRDFHFSHWDEAIGASGTLRSINQILMENDWSNNGITLDGLQKLARYLIKKKHLEHVNLDGLDPERLDILPGGLAIIYATFMSLGLQQMTVSEGALREGLIVDLVGRIHNHDIRSETIKILAKRYHTEKKHAHQIKETLRSLVSQLTLPPAIEPGIALQWLNWAADLHEIGHDIAHNQYHKHSAYIIENADLPGFSRQDQLLLGALVISHRRKLSFKTFNNLPYPWDKNMIYLVMVLRLAVVLHRNRNEADLPPFKCTLNGQTLILKFPTDWLAQYPLTLADLNDEAKHLTNIGFQLTFE
jgi:exopolyphosphatase/guanosine-5'-triphosphate,3'-diphosphate pyrophosphatase